MEKSVEKIKLGFEVVKVTLTGNEVERKAEASKVMKLATDFGAKSISQREEVEKTFLTFQTGNNGDVLKAVLSNWNGIPSAVSSAGGISFFVKTIRM